MTIWFLVILACQSPGDWTTCHNDGPPVMTFVAQDECQAVIMEALRLATEARKSVGYACEQGLAL